MKFLLTVIAALFLAQPALAADAPAGKVTYLKGSASLYQTGRSTATPLAPDAPVFAGDEIETAAGAAVTVTFSDDSTVTMGENGTLTVEQYLPGKTPDAAPRKNHLQILRAAFAYASGGKTSADTRIDIDFGSIGIRGTHFIRGMKDGQCWIYLHDGAITVKNGGGSVDLASGQGTRISGKDTAPETPAAWGEDQIAWLRTELPANVMPPAQQAVTPAPEPVATPQEAPAPAPQPAPEPAPIPAPESVPQPAPVPEPAPQPAPQPEPAPQPVPQPAPETPQPAPANPAQAPDQPAPQPDPVPAMPVPVE